MLKKIFPTEVSGFSSELQHLTLQHFTISVRAPISKFVLKNKYLHEVTMTSSA